MYEKIDRIINTLVEAELICITNTGSALIGTIEDCEKVGVSKADLKYARLI